MNPQLVVLCCVAGAGGSVMLGYAVFSFLGRRDPAAEIDGDPGFSQAQYQRAVRLRNQDNIAMFAGGRRDYKRQFSSDDLC